MTEGRVSFSNDEGRRMLDTAELERVYRDQSRPVRPLGATMVSRDRLQPVADFEAELERLRAEIEELKGERRHLLERLERQEATAAAERERWLGIIERYTQRLLPSPVSNMLGSLLPSWLTGATAA